MKSPQPTRILRITLGVVFGFTLLGLAEVTARIAGIQPTYQHDKLGQWRVTSGLEDQSFSEEQGGHYFRVSTNSDGFRTTVEPALPQGQLRVALMGDSTVFGWGVDNGESIAEVAQASLTHTGHSVQVINLGQPGYSTAFVGELFRETVAKYKPDLTIVFVPMHDYNLSLVSDLEFLQGSPTFHGAMRAWLIQHVSLYELLRRQLYPLASEAQLLPHQSSKEARVERVSAADRRTVLNQMRRIASKWGGDVSVGFLPFYADLQRGSGANQSRSGMASMHLIRRPGVESLKAWSGEHRRPMFDLRSCCALGAQDRTFPFDHSHLNVLGNQEVGLALAEAIREASGVVSPED